MMRCTTKLPCTVSAITTAPRRRSPVTQGPQRDDAAAAEEGQHALSLDADSYVLAFEQQVPRLGEGDPVRYGFFHDQLFSGSLFPSEDRGVGEFGRCLVRQAGQVPHRGLCENVRQRTADSVLQIAVVGECRGQDGSSDPTARKIDSRVISLAGAWLNRTIPAIGREMLR